MSYSHQVPYYLGKPTTSGFGYVVARRDAGTDSDTDASFHAPVDEDGGVILTPSASATHSAHELDEVQSFGSFTRAGSVSSSPPPSTTGDAARRPSIDSGELLQREFDNLTIRDKVRALASVHKSKSCSSRGSSETNTEILTETDAVRIGDSDEPGVSDHQSDSTKPSLATWQTLCKAVGVTDEEMPRSITQCKKTLRGYNANVYDVAAALLHGTVARTFPSIAALARYSKREDKLISKALVKMDPLLKVMLRELFRGANGKGKK